MVIGLPNNAIYSKYAKPSYPSDSRLPMKDRTLLPQSLSKANLGDLEHGKAYIGGSNGNAIETGIRCEFSNFSFASPPAALPQLPTHTEDGKEIVYGGPRVITGVDSYVCIDHKYGMFVQYSDHEYSYAPDGSGVHGFGYLDTMFLEESAAAYSTLSENQVFADRRVADAKFIANTLDFFVGEGYTQDDVDAMKAQIDSIVSELADQFRAGQELDYSKVETKFNIRGAEFSLTELVEMQDALKQIGATALDCRENQGATLVDFAKLGVAEAAAKYYGGTKGEIGALFADGFSRMIDKNMQAFTQRLNYIGMGQRSAAGKQARAIFAGMNTEDKDSLLTDFKAKTGQYASLLQSEKKSTGSGNILIWQFIQAVQNQFNTLFS